MLTQGPHCTKSQRKLAEVSVSPGMNSTLLSPLPVAIYYVFAGHSPFLRASSFLLVTLVGHICLVYKIPSASKDTEFEIM